jgi:predicted nucleic acid-binding protein
LSLLYDSSILVAAIAKDHPRHVACAEILQQSGAALVFDHSLLEAYRVLSAPNAKQGGFDLHPQDVVIALRHITRLHRYISLTTRERLDAMSVYAARNVISAHIYDAMIGYAGILHGARRIMTLNGKNFRSLFPELEIIEPA